MAAGASSQRARRRHRDGRRRGDEHETGAASPPRSAQGDALRAASRGGRAGAKAWIGLLQSVVGAVEATLIDARDIAAQAAEVFHSAKGELEELSERFEELSLETAQWSQKRARAAKTALMLAKVVGSYRLIELRAAFADRERAKRMMRDLHSVNAARYYQTTIEQGGAFLKVGQMLSTRPDIMPRPWIAELSKLQDAAPPFAFADVERIIAEDLGQRPHELFASFDEEPVAAASIGQVHRATTRNGLEVAVKVQRPDIARLMEVDLELLDLALEGLTSMLPPTDYDTIKAEIRDALGAELDYRREAASMARMAAFFAGAEKIRVPSTVEALCSPRVLTSTFEKGRKINVVLDELSGPAGDAGALSDVLGRLVEAYIRQILEAGFFQADPHPGNFLVAEDGTLVLLDFGCSREISQEMRAGFRNLLLASFAGDRARMEAIFTELGFATKSGKADSLHVFADALLGRIKRGIAGGDALVWQSRKQTFETVADMLDAANADPIVRIPPEFVMIARVMAMISGTLEHYRPTIDWSARVLRYL